jgi:rod shape-determining protein MreC
VLVSLALITVYFRESQNGGLHEAQQIGLSVLTPFEVAGERISRPFDDAWGYVSELLDAKDENAKLEAQIEALRQELVQNQTAARENDELRRVARYLDGARFPDDYRGVATRVIARPPSPYAQDVVVAAGSDDGISKDDPVVTPDGLVGIVSEVGSNASKVTLLTDQQSAVSALVLQSGTPGVVRHGPSPSNLVLDRVGKEALVSQGDTVVTAGWRSGKLESLFPYGIPIGTVAAVGQNDVDLFKRIQVTPLVDFDSLGSVVVLVRRADAPPAEPR